MAFESFAIWSRVTSLISFPTHSDSRQTLHLPIPQKEQVHCRLWELALDRPCPRMFFSYTPTTLLFTSFRSLVGVIFSVRTTPTHSNSSRTLPVYFSTALVTIPHSVYFIISSFGGVYCCLPLWLGSANYGLWVRSSLLPVFANKVLMGHSNAHSFVHFFMDCSWLLLCYNGRIEQLQETLWFTKPKIFPIGPLLEC